jgi:hypothetical protein
MPRDPVLHSNEPSAADSPFDIDDGVDDAALTAVMRHVRAGADEIRVGEQLQDRENDGHRSAAHAVSARQRVIE